MKYSNSIEGYCQSPLTVDQVKELRACVAKGVAKEQLVGGFYIAASGISVAAFIITSLLGVLSGFAVFLGLMGVCFVVLLGGACVNELSAHKGISLKIHGVNMATYETFADYIVLSSEARIASPLAKTLVENIRNEKRPMLQFEKDLINRLIEI
jgi:hypothetical protein